jgi:histidyl-tRNA synthetase
MRHADRLGAQRAVILGEDGRAQLRDMRSGEQQEIDIARVVEELARR